MGAIQPHHLVLCGAWNIFSFIRANLCRKQIKLAFTGMPPTCRGNGTFWKKINNTGFIYTKMNFCLTKCPYHIYFHPRQYQVFLLICNNFVFIAVSNCLNLVKFKDNSDNFIVDSFIDNSLNIIS